MDPGTVVWLPGGGDFNDACAAQYGNYYACGDQPWQGGTMVYCCPY